MASLRAVDQLAVTFVAIAIIVCAVGANADTIRIETPNAPESHEPGVSADAPFGLRETTVESDRPVPRACLSFTRPLDRARAADMLDHIQVEPAATLAATVRDNTLCVEGFRHGTSYSLTLLPGLPAQGAALTAAQTLAIAVTDRPASVAFATRGSVLPQLGEGGLPIRTVNVDEVEITIARIHDQNLIDHVASGIDSAWQAESVGSYVGEPVWSGVMGISADKNQVRVTAIPIDETIGTLEPGVYVATVAMKRADEVEEHAFGDTVSPATLWFVVSDIALTVYQGDHGLLVSVRSLASAAPVSGATVALRSSNDKELARRESDAQGFVRFEPGLLRGEGGNAAAALYAYGASGAFVTVGLRRAGLDLSDRGIAGRSVADGLEAFLYTERGIYRPGETVHLTALLRDAQAVAVPQTPLTVAVNRADGVEVNRVVLTDEGAASYTLAIPIPDAGQIGTWGLYAYVNPDDPPVGSTSFQVKDFVPPTVEVTVEPPRSHVEEGVSSEVTVQASYLAGGAASSLSGELVATVRTARDPFPDHAGYVFGLARDREFLPFQLSPVPFKTGDDGAARPLFEIAEVPATTQPIEVLLSATVFEVSGRPVTAHATAPVATHPFFIGVRPRFEGVVADDALADFDVLVVDQMGTPIARPGLRWELVQEHAEWHYYRTINRHWNWRRVVRDSAPLAGGVIAASAEAPATIAQAVDWGEYRIEVFDETSAVATSVRFRVGAPWWFAGGARQAEIPPDEVEVRLNAETVSAGETIDVFVKPPYESEVVLVVADDRVRSVQSTRIGSDGATLRVAIPDDALSGTYIMATAYAPANAARRYLPRRAVGVAWVPIDLSARQLAVSLEAPDLVTPRQTIEVPIAVDGAPGERVFVTLAAVDDGVLGLTGYGLPDPFGYFLGQRQLGITLRDMYGGLIDPRADQRGEIRSGGGGAALASRQLSDLPKHVHEVFARFSGVVALDAAGRARVPLVLPDFNGRARLMAVAWTSADFGAAEGTTIVRDPVVADLGLPRFLAAGDVAELALSLRNMDGAGGAYTATLSTDGALAVVGEAATTASLAEGEQARHTYRLWAQDPGDGRVTLTVEGPAGYRVVRRWPMTVRAINRVETQRRLVQLEPGQSFVIDKTALDGFDPGTARIAVRAGGLPQYDVAGIAASLIHYPFYDTKIQVSRMVPHIAVPRVVDSLGLEDAASRDETLARMRDGILARQTARGSFAPRWIYWGERPEEWTSAYVMDTLTRAERGGLTIARGSVDRATRWMTRFISIDSDKPYHLANQAYVYYVLAQRGVIDAGRVRRFDAAQWRALPSDLARALVAAALAAAGEPTLAREGFRTLLSSGVSKRHLTDKWRAAPYGSEIRDRAAILSLMAESGLMPSDALRAPLLRLAQDVAARAHLTAPEMAWLLRLAAAADALPAPAVISVDGEARTLEAGSVPLIIAGAELSADAVTLRNDGRTPISLAVSLTGRQVKTLPPASEVFYVKRHIRDRFGNPVDLANVTQGDLLVMTIEGGVLDHTSGRLTTMLDMLPAGFETVDLRLDRQRCWEADDPWCWLKPDELTKLRWMALRGDRVVASFTLNRSKWERDDQDTFRLAYVVRAATPGDFVMPPVVVEDAANPGRFARSATARVSISPR